jgi:hypothetical protein
MTTPAKTVSEAYYDQLWQHDSDVWSSIDAGADYVPRTSAEDGPLKPVHLKIREHLLRSKGQVQYLLTSQTGAGKSTELHQLVSDAEVQKRYEVVVLDARDKLNLLRFVDIRHLMISISELLASRIQERTPASTGWMGIALNRAQSVREWVRVLGGSRGELPDPSQVNAREFFDSLFEALTGMRTQLKSDDLLRESLARTEISPIRNMVALLADELVRVAGRSLLLIVDTLDRVERESWDHLFRTHLDTLRNLPMQWVMTMPYALRFDLSAALPPSLLVTLPNVKVVARGENQLRPRASQFFTALLRKLVDTSLVDQDVIDRAALLSAGIPREFLRIVHQAFGMANDLEADHVKGFHLDLAVGELRKQLQPLHVDPSVKLLLELVRIQPDVLLLAQRGCMQALLVVEYTNDKQWYDVHPLLVPEYERRAQDRAVRLGVSRSDVEKLAEDIERQLGS